MGKGYVICNISRTSDPVRVMFLVRINHYDPIDVSQFVEHFLSFINDSQVFIFTQNV